MSALGWIDVCATAGRGEGPRLQGKACHHLFLFKNLTGRSQGARETSQRARESQRAGELENGLESDRWRAREPATEPQSQIAVT